MHVIVAGCGWLGTAIARRFVQDGARVTGIRRDPARAGALREHGIEPLALDLAAAGGDPAGLPTADAIVACQSAGGDTPDAYRAAYVEANRTLLAAAARDGARLVYTGSTGVFGQRDGGDVDEATPVAPANATAAVLVEAEALVREAAARGVAASTLRLSGLYGPGRLGLVERVRGGQLALGPGDQAWMNFCHLDDAVSFVVAALARGEAGATYHGSDAGPAMRREVVAWIAERIGVAPRQATRPPGAAAPGPAGPNRRILSARTREALDVWLAYPTFREGLVPAIPAAHPRRIVPPPG